MMNPVSGQRAAAHAGYSAHQAVSKPAEPQKPQSRQPDKVTIKGSGGGADHDGDKT